MRYVYYTLFFTLLGVIPARSQDLVVSNHGDSLNCRITKIYGGNVYFNYVRAGLLKDSMLTMPQVVYYQINYFAGGSSSSAGAQKENEFIPRFSAALGGGASYMIRKLPKDLPDWQTTYLNQLRNGYHFAADLSFYIYKNSGFGIRYSFMRTSNQLDDVAFYYDSVYKGTGLLRDDITIHYIGPTLFGKIKLGRRKSLWLGSTFSVGYLGFINNAYLIDKFKITSNTLGGSWLLSADYFIGKKISIGVNVSSVLGRISEIWLTDGPAVYANDRFEYYFNLSRVDAGFEVKGYL